MLIVERHGAGKWQSKGSDPAKSDFRTCALNHRDTPKWWLMLPNLQMGKLRLRERQMTSQGHKAKALLNPEVESTSETSLLLESPVPLVSELCPRFPGGHQSSRRSEQLGLRQGAACESSSSLPASLALLFNSCVGLGRLLAFFEAPLISASVKWV